MLLLFEKNCPMNFKTVKKLIIVCVACLAPARFWSVSDRFWSVPGRFLVGSCLVLVGSGGFMLYQVRMTSLNTVIRRTENRNVFLFIVFL